MKKFFYTAAIFLSALPFTAHAHERWFVKDVTPAMTKPLLFSAWSNVNATMVLLAVAAFIAAILIHFALRSKAWVRKTASCCGGYGTWVSLVLRTLTGLLLFTASLFRFLFAPNLMASELAFPLANALLAIQLLAGFGLVIGIFPRFMSILGLVLYLVALFVFPAIDVLGYMFFVGIFIYLIIMGDPALPKVRGAKMFHNAELFVRLERAKPYAMPILRIFAGLSFLLVAFIYKIYNPVYALEFLRMHPVNFMSALGFANFSNEMFVLACGLTEMLLGLMIVLGLLPRLVGAALLFLFTLTLSIFGITELLGHLPLYAVAFALVAKGSGEGVKKRAGALR